MKTRKNIKAKTRTEKRMISYLLAYKPKLIGAMLADIGSNIFFLLAPFVMGLIIDRMVGPGQVDFTYINKNLLLLGLIYLGGSGFNLIKLRLTNDLVNSSIEDLRQDVFRKINHLEVNYFDSHAHGDIMSRFTNDIDFIATGLMDGINQLFSGLLIIVASLVFMLYLSLPMTLIVLIISPLCLWVTSYINRKSRDLYRAQSRLMGNLNGYAEEMIANQKLVKAFNYEDRSFEKFEKLNDELYIYGQKAQFYSSLTNPSTRFINNISYILVCILGGLMAVRGQISVGRISSFLIYSTQFSKPINEITGLMSQFQLALASAERVFSLLDEKEEEDIVNEEDVKRELRGDIIFDQVYFSYYQEKPLIEDLNLHIRPGSSVAIVGPTGAGKTTLINLLMRFYELDKGTIKIDGRDISKLERDDLRKSFGMVLQDTWIFEGTIRENISYARPDASEKDLEEVIDKSHCRLFIDRLAQGYDTVIGKNDGNISQGEEQLICIARAMLADPSILILDEATSNIDSLTEIEVQKGFKELMDHRTSFVIAHRLSTIVDADLILVLKDGHIIERGNHQELLAQDGFYKELYTSQFMNSQDEN